MLRAPSSFATITFAAPIGVRVRMVTVLVFAITAAMAFLPVWLHDFDARASGFNGAWLAPAIALPIILVILVLAIIREYRVTGDQLEVVRLGRVNRFPLAGLADVTANPAAMHRAWKLWGNDGLGAITGRFRSKQLGNFEALLTNPPQAVVLRWPDRTLVVSPDRTPYFVETVRERANLRS
jgi:hypothetical protein